MKLLVFSDVHKYKERLIALLNHYDDIDLTISLGDSELKRTFLESHDIVAIKGNYPFDAGFTEEHILTIDGYRVLLSHGHRYRVQNGIDKLYYRALEESIQVVFYGHTHIPSFDDVEGRLFINPGAVSKSRSLDQESYMIVKTSKAQWIFRWYNAMDHSLIREIRHDF